MEAHEFVCRLVDGCMRNTKAKTFTELIYRLKLSKENDLDYNFRYTLNESFYIEVDISPSNSMDIITCSMQSDIPTTLKYQNRTKATLAFSHVTGEHIAHYTETDHHNDDLTLLKITTNSFELEPYD